MVKRALYITILLILMVHLSGLNLTICIATDNLEAVKTMLNMAEEETHKTKKGKAGVDDEVCVYHHPYAIEMVSNLSASFCTANSAIGHQFLMEQPTPPPNWFG